MKFWRREPIESLHERDDARLDQWDNHEIKTSLETLGTLDWTWFEFNSNDTSARMQEVSNLPQFSAQVRSQLGYTQRTEESIALIDQTSLHNAHKLLTRDWTHDPFVAILDLTSVVGAAIFYDRIAVLGNNDKVQETNELLNLDDAIHAITVPALNKRRYRMESMLSSCFDNAVSELDDAEIVGAPWMSTLKATWRKLLPQVSFPSHRTLPLLQDLFYSTSPGPQILQAIFDVAHDTFDFANKSDLQNLILYNDVRGLFYEKVASAMSAMLADDQFAPPVHFIGNCLRTPMSLARAQLAKSLLKPNEKVQNWLQREWAKKYVNSEYAVRMPFWINAVLADVSTMADFGHSVRRIRNAAAGLRKRRREIETALSVGNAPLITNLRAAFNGEADRFQRSVEQFSRAAIDSAGLIAAPYLPPGTIRSLAQAAAKYGPTDWVQKLALRLFRPHLWFVHSLGRKATTLQRSVEKMFTLFDFPTAQTDKPVEFLERLASIV